MIFLHIGILQLYQVPLQKYNLSQQIKFITDALIDAQKKTTPNKITQLRGPKWKASSPVLSL
jgi:hypothetical protein